MIEKISQTGIVVFSDLDGTLLDHETYEWSPAKAALELLHNERIPLILASSKTAAEIAPLREAMGFSRCEAIVENGAGILEPGSVRDGATDEHQRILEVLREIPLQLSSHFEGFSKWSVQEVSRQTGLSQEAAALARQRQFSEPGLWKGPANILYAFCQALSDHGIVAQQGGRFLSLSMGGTKADRMSEIIARYSRGQEPCLSIALGDAPNDVAMLENANYGIIVANPAHSGIVKLAGESAGRIVRSQKAGPAGWNEMLPGLLRKLKQEKAAHG